MARGFAGLLRRRRRFYHLQQKTSLNALPRSAVKSWSAQEPKTPTSLFPLGRCPKNPRPFSPKVRKAPHTRGYLQNNEFVDLGRCILVSRYWSGTEWRWGRETWEGERIVSLGEKKELARKWTASLSRKTSSSEADLRVFLNPSAPGRQVQRAAV